MAKYKIGDIVRLKIGEKTYSVGEGCTGVIVDYQGDPIVELDDSRRFCIAEFNLELFDPSSEISQIIEQSITKSAEKIPVDKFEFCYIDEYGRDLTHRFEQQEGYYDLSDVIASFRLFLLGVGYEREEVNGIIREDRL